jgi:membrane fusion protein (multidrug efflux system)
VSNRPLPRPRHFFSSHRSLIQIALAMGVSSLLMACGEDAPPPPPPPEVPVVKVIQRDQPILVDFVGETRGSSDIPIRARVEGVLLGMHFKEGQRVNEGDLLYNIDPEAFDAKVVEAQGHLSEAVTRLAKAKADLSRIKPLAEMNAVSQQDLDSAQAQYDAALGSLQAGEARLEQTQIEHRYTKIHSPIDGRIGISEAHVGEFVGKAPNPVVLNYVSLTNPIRVRFAIDERSYLRLARRINERQKAVDEGSEVDTSERAGLELILADGSIHEYRGRAVGWDAAIDPSTGTFTLEADFPNPEELVLAGQFARVRSEMETFKGALLIPQRSIRELQGIFQVFVVTSDGTVELRTVEVGAKIGKLQIATSGLKVGEQVALDTMRLRAGMTVVPKVQAVEEKTKPSKSAPGGA